MKRKVAALFATEDGEFPWSMSVLKTGEANASAGGQSMCVRLTCGSLHCSGRAECVRMKSTADLWLHRRSAF